jgi:hypothetical protein
MATSRVSYKPTTDNTSYASFTDWRSQVFTTPATGFKLNRVDIKWAKDVSTGNYILELYAVDGSDKPTGAALSTGGAAISTLPVDGGGDGTSVTTITMAEYTVAAATKYALVARAGTSGGSFGIRALVAGAYSGGSFWSSADSGTSWSDISWDMYFDVWGDDATTAYTITADVGSFTLTGIAIGLSKGFAALVAAVGQFILTGIDVVLTKKGWTNPTKNNSTAVNSSKNAISPTNSSKNNSTFVNQSKS